MHYSNMAIRALWLTIFIAAAGAPIPASLVLFASAAFAALGDFNIFILFLVVWSAAVMGDNLGYLIGRRVGTILLAWLKRQKRFRWITLPALTQSQAYFRRRGGWAIFMRRFLFSALGGSINLLAGIEQYPYRSFLFWGCDWGSTRGNYLPQLRLRLCRNLGGSRRPLRSLLRSSSYLADSYRALHPTRAKDPST